MKSEKRLSCELAMRIAGDVMAVLDPACERIEIAGSLRRGKVDVGDVDLLAIPRFEVVRNLIGDVVGRRHEVAETATAAGLSVIKSGNRYLVLEVDGCPVDVWLADRDEWGVKLALRTGSNDFSHWLVTQRKQGGALPDYMTIKDSRLWRWHTALCTCEERMLFDAIGLDWERLHPGNREQGKWGKWRQWALAAGAREWPSAEAAWREALTGGGA